MSNGIELKAIIDSRIQQLKQDIGNSKTPFQSTSKLKIRAKEQKIQTPTVETFDLESSWVALSRKSKLYNEYSQDADFDESEDCLVDFTKKEISKTRNITDQESLDPWVEIVDEFGRNRLVRSSTLGKPVESLEKSNLETHYDPTREIRNLGTSHYKFSSQESKRQLELQELNNLRAQTATEQQNLANLKDIDVDEVEIGSGSFAKVYKGKRNGSLVAIKVVKKQQLNSKILEALESEIKIQSSIIHSHLVHLQEIIRDSDFIYLVMEYCDLGDLSGYIKVNFPLKEDLVLNFISQLSMGMEFLRLNSLIHRDIKPQNILLSSISEREMPCLKIGDFGFARALPISGMADTLCGSPLYMAPEILKGEKYDGKSDLWSLGTVFYEMVTSKPPFRANNHIELLRKIEERDGPKWNNVEIKDSLKDLISRLLKKNPLERMSFEEFFLHPCVIGDSQSIVSPLKLKESPIIESRTESPIIESRTESPLKESKLESQHEIVQTDSPFPGYGVDSKIFESLKTQEKEKYDFVHIKPISASVKWIQESQKVSSSLIITCPWKTENTMNVLNLSQSDEGMILVFALRVSCLETLLFSEFIPSADSPYEWSIVLDLCLLCLDLYQTCLDYCRSYFRSHRSFSRDLKELCSWVVSRTGPLITESELASSLIPDDVDWDPPLILNLVLDKISSSLESNPPPSSILILSCLVNLVLADNYSQSIASRHSSEFMNSLSKRLNELMTEAKLALAKKKLLEFQSKKSSIQPSESVGNLVDLYNESTHIESIPVKEQTAEEAWIDKWVKKVNSLKEKAATSASLKPVLTALGVSTNIVDVLEFSNTEVLQVSPAKLDDIQLPVIPEVEFKNDPQEYQNALLNKIKILTESLEKLQKTYLEETSKRKIMENSVAQITLSIVTGLEKEEKEKTRFKKLLDESQAEKNKLKSQLQDLIKKNQELTEEIYLKQTQIPNERKKSELELELQKVNQDLFAAQKTCQGLQHTLEVKQSEWIRKSKDMEDAARSTEMEKASLAVLKSQIENMKFTAEDELKKALDLKAEVEELQNQLNSEKKELQDKTEYLGDAQRILDHRVEKMDQMSQAKDTSFHNQLQQQKEALESLQTNLEVEKEQLLKDRTELLEKEKRFIELEKKENSISKKGTYLISKETELAEKESGIQKREKLVAEKEALVLNQIQKNEANKGNATSKLLEEEYKLRQEELSKSIRSFNEFKEQLEASYQEREGKFNQKIQNLENEKKEAIKKLSEEKNVLESKIKKLEEQIIFSTKKTNQKVGKISKDVKPEDSPISEIDERVALEQEKSIISEIKTKTEQESEFVKTEKARILEEANQLEKEWMSVRLKEAEITKAMADISVAAAQQAVGSSISTAETLISRDQIRELEFENRELIKENEQLRIKISGKDIGVGISNATKKNEHLVVSPLFKTSSLGGNDKLVSPVLPEVSPDLSKVIFNLTQSNQDLKNRIEHLVKTFERKNASTPSNFLGIVDEDYGLNRPLSRINDRKSRKPIADPRMIQSAFGNPIAITFSGSPDMHIYSNSIPRQIPSLKSTPVRPASADLRRPETSQSNYSVPAERVDIVKVLDAQVSSKMKEIEEMLEEKSSPKKAISNISDTEKERIRSLVKQRIMEKKKVANS